MKKKIIAVLLIIMVPLIVGCGNNNDTLNIVKANEINVEFDSDSLSQDNIDSLNEYSIEMAKELLKEHESENFVTSPFSLWMPLTALGNATNEAALHKHLESLKFKGSNMEQINDFAAGLLYKLNNEDYREYCRENNIEFIDSIYIANALFLNKKYEAKEDFVDVFHNYYKGATMLVDFESDEAKDRVNEWVYDNTDGNIEDIVDEFDPKTVAALANTIYFKSAWEKEFDKDMNESRLFYGEGEESETEFMVMDGEQSYFVQDYYEDETLQMVDFPYTNNAGMMIILPKTASAYELFMSLDLDYFNRINREAKRLSGKTYLPKFKIESGVMNLMDVMETMGVPLLDGYIDNLVYADNDLFISDAYQKAMIEVNEEGTTAAAATIVEMMETAIEPAENENFLMDCNKPFIFILYGDMDNSKQILFTGIVTTP